MPKARCLKITPLFRVYHMSKFHILQCNNFLKKYIQPFCFFSVQFSGGSYKSVETKDSGRIGCNTDCSRRNQHPLRGPELVSKSNWGTRAQPCISLFSLLIQCFFSKELKAAHATVRQVRPTILNLSLSLSLLSKFLLGTLFQVPCPPVKQGYNTNISFRNFSHFSISLPCPLFKCA